MRSNFLQLRKLVIHISLLLLITVVSYAQYNLSEIKREISMRSLYTTTQNEKGDIFAGTWGAGIWKSSNDGNSWTRASEGLQSYDIRKLIIGKNGRIFAATSSGLFFTDDNALSWKIILLPDANAGYRNILIKDNSILLISDNGLVFQSFDNGQNWSQNGKIPEAVVIAPLVLLQNKKILVGTEKGLYVSDDDGRSWTKSDNYLRDESIIDIYYINGKVFITTLSKGLFISKDGSESVSALNDGMSAKRIKFINSDSKENIIASTYEDGIYLLDEERDVWKKVNQNFGSAAVEFLSMKKNGKIIAGTSSGSVYVSQNVGQNWNENGGKLICAIPNTKFVEVKASDKVEKSYFPPPFEFYKKKLNKTSAATVIVTYTGFSAEAQTAFQYAVDIWSSFITSAVPIRINATYTALGAGILGSAGPATAYTGFENQPYINTWYPVALAEKLNGDRLNLNTGPDIVANFNSNFSNWYFGTDGSTPFANYDFVSVVLHELCHGLGYVGSFNYSGGTGSWGDASYHFPYIFDRFLYNGSGQQLMNTGLFSNPSTDLGSQLTGDNLYWTGPAAGTARMYAPGSWSGGSSIYHLNESTYPPGSGNNLMTYALSNGEAIHSPGSIVLNQMSDMGWATSSPVTYGISGSIKDGSNVAISGVTVTLSGSASGTATTNLAGAFSFSGLNSGGSYTLTPSKTNYSFLPANRTYSNLSGDQTAANFTGTPKPVVSLSSVSLAYGDVKTSQVSDKVLTITNSGLGVLTISALTFSGADTASFRLVGPPSLPLTINPSSNQTLTIRFAPNSVAAKTATFTIAHNATGGTTNVSLSGNGTASNSTWSQNKTSINFDSLGYLSTPGDSLLLISNTSSGDTLIITSVIYTGGNNKFSITETLPIKIAQNSSKSIHIRFNPDSTGSFSGTLTMNNNSGNIPAATLSVTGKVFGSVTNSNTSFVNFGIVGIESGNRDSTIEIYNTGNYKLKIYSINLVSADTSIEIISSLPSGGLLINPGSKYNLSIRLKPNVLGTRTGTLTIRNNSSNNPTMIVTVSATVLQSYLTFSSPSVNFDSATVSTPFRIINLIVRNSTTLLKSGNINKSLADVTITDKVISGDTISFKLVNKKVNVMLPAGASDTIQVMFFPRSLGIKNAILTIRSNDLTPNRTINLSGIGGGKPIINVNLVSVNYGDCSAGIIKDTTVILKNTGNLDLTVSSKSFSGTDNTGFNFLSGGSSKILGYNESDTIKFRFTALLPAGAKSAQLVVNSNDPASLISNVSLLANIKFAAITKNTSTIQYRETDVGGKSDTTFSIRNTGNSDLDISKMMIDGAYASDFLLGGNYNNTKLLPNEEKIFKVSFIPSEVGLRYARLAINSNDQTKPEDFIVLRGDGRKATLPSLMIALNKIEFGAVGFGSYRDTVISLNNTGSADLQIDSLNIIGADRNLFTIIGKIFPFSILPGQAENYTIRYQPVGTSASVILRIKSNDNQKPVVEISLSGNITEPALVLADSIYDFGTANAGDSVAKNIKIKNVGSAALKIDSITINDNKNNFFYLLPEMPLYILSNTEYNLSVKFKPTEAKNYASVIYIKSNDPNRGIRTVALFGSGTAPKMLLSQKVDFGKVMNGDSKISGFRIANAGNTLLKVSGINITGTHASEFEVIGKVFPYNIIDGQSDSVSVKFSVKSTGVKNASVKITANDITAPNEITISAEGIVKVSVDDNNPIIPNAYSLKQNYPNPFNPSTKIKYSIRDAGFVSIKVYDVFGREVSHIVNGVKSAGNYEINFDAASAAGGLTSGIYFYTLKVNNYSETRKMILMK